MGAPLAAWGTCGTWSRGVQFVPRRAHALGPPDEGTIAPLRRHAGLAVNPVVTFAVERRRGWTDAAGTPPRDPERDPWDEYRADRVVMEKQQPAAGSAVLAVHGVYAGFREGPFRGRPRDIEYTLRIDGAPRRLDDVQWADWDAVGGLMVATIDGSLQIRAVGDSAVTVVWEHSLADVAPDPRPAPSWARRW